MDEETGLNTAICPVCGVLSEGDKLLNIGMKDLTADQKVNHYELCPLHKKQFNKGYIALIIINEERSVKTDSGNISINGAFRTGEYIHMKRKYFDALFDAKTNENSEIVFINEETAELIKKKIRENNPNA